MTDDKNKLGFQDRFPAAGDAGYEVGYVASRFGLTLPEVRELIATHGNDRETVEREAKKLSGR